MANEIQFNFLLNYSNGGATLSIPPAAYMLNQVNGALVASGIVLVDTSQSNIPLGAVATPGLLVMMNLDPANYVQWGPNVSTVLQVTGRLNPLGATPQPGIFVVDPTITMCWKAHTAPCYVQYWLFGD